MREIKYSVNTSFKTSYHQELEHECNPKFGISDIIFRPNQRDYIASYHFGIACGIIWAILAALFTFMGINGSAILITNFFETIFPDYHISNVSTRIAVLTNVGIGVIFGFIYGCLFGLLVSWIYNRLLGTIYCDVKLKGNIPDGKPVILVEEGNSEPKARKDDAYTVVILANPILETRCGDPKYKKDPILCHPNLFKAKVECILDSLTKCEILRPQVGKGRIHKMRIVAIFDTKRAEVLQRASTDVEKRANALCLEDEIGVSIEPIQGNFIQKGTNKWCHRKLNTEICAEEGDEIDDRLNEYFEDNYNEIGRIDVVFAVTASYTNTRSSAHYTLENGPSDSSDFKLIGKKRDDTVEFQRPGLYAPEEILCPGLVAYSAWDNRIKTPIHEFAHAMSSPYNGMIEDEYIDHKDFTDDYFAINKRIGDVNIWDKDGDRKIQISEFPDEFVEYQEGTSSKIFLTDKNRHQSDDWLSFVPARNNHCIPCTMDRSYDEYEFDTLIKYFMCKRLDAKIAQVRDK